MPDNALVQQLLKEAQEEVDKEDRKAAVAELKSYLKKGRWDRIRNPVYQRGIYHGAITMLCLIGMVLFLTYPIWRQ